MKIQVLELPEEYAGDYSRTPFIVVFSEVTTEAQVDKILNAWNARQTEEGEHPWGSSGMYATTEPVEL